MPVRVHMDMIVHLVSLLFDKYLLMLGPLRNVGETAVNKTDIAGGS